MRRGTEISYSSNDSGATNSFNESLSIGEDEQSLCLKSLGLSSIFSGQQLNQNLSEEGAAELLWALFIEPLQRNSR